MPTKNCTPITQSTLKKFLHYDQYTGLFTRKIRTSQNTRVGDIAGWKDNYGYVNICLNGIRYKSHRLAFLYVNGKFPTHEVDHINHVPGDDRFCNLRQVTHAENQKNISLQKNNKSGITGVSWSKEYSTWQVRIKHNGKMLYARSHKSFHKAVAIRKALEVMLGYDPNHGSK